jgi:hypothetical protein
MRLTAFEAIARALEAAEVRYLVAGGLAVNAHGYIRHTSDIDLVISLDADNIQRAFGALETLGYRQLVPIKDSAFADAAQLQQCREEKAMQVLNFHSDAYRGTTVDVFVHEPFDFAHEYELALQGEILPGVVARFVSIPTLIEMKRLAGRPRDLDDIQHLQWLQEINRDG